MVRVLAVPRLRTASGSGSKVDITTQVVQLGSVVHQLSDGRWKVVELDEERVGPHAAGSELDLKGVAGLFFCQGCDGLAQERRILFLAVMAVAEQARLDGGTQELATPADKFGQNRTKEAFRIASQQETAAAILRQAPGDIFRELGLLHRNVVIAGGAVISVHLAADGGETVFDKAVSCAYADNVVGNQLTVNGLSKAEKHLQETRRWNKTSTGQGAQQSMTVFKDKAAQFLLCQEKPGGTEQ